jgi:hypothetical protein
MAIPRVNAIGLALVTIRPSSQKEQRAGRPPVPGLHSWSQGVVKGPPTRPIAPALISGSPLTLRNRSEERVATSAFLDHTCAKRPPHLALKTCGPSYLPGCTPSGAIFTSHEYRRFGTAAAFHAYRAPQDVPDDQIPPAPGTKISNDD